MKYLSKLKNYFTKYVVLIFLFLVVISGFSEVKPVYASGFEEWEFNIVDGDGNSKSDNSTKKKAQQYTIKIKDGDTGYLEDKAGKGEVWNELINRYKVFIFGIMGIATLTMVLIAMILFTKLSATAPNPQERAHTIKWIGVFLIAAGLLGSVTVIFTYSYGVFR